MELDPRIIMWNYSFTAKINFFGPATNVGNTGSVIKYVEANIFDAFPEVE